MRASRLLILVLLASFAGWSTLAQQNGAEPESDEGVEQQEEAASEGGAAEPPTPAEIVSSGGEFEAFDPSEDISEDLSVPFPVDI